MRTTIRIDDELYRTLKTRAAASGRTVAQVIEDAVRAGLAQEADAEDADLAPLPTFGGGGVSPGVELRSNAAAREAMDEDEPLDALR